MGTKRSLSEAAAELVRAAEMEVDVATQRQLIERLEELKESVDTKLDSIQQVVEQSSTNSTDSINTVNQNIVHLSDKIDLLNETMKNNQKMQSLEWAFQNAEYGSFDYFVPAGNGVVNSYSKRSSTTLVRNALMSFRKGVGRYIDDGLVADRDPSNRDEQRKEAFREQFRKKIVAQVYALTGVEPLLQKETDVSYTIHYSHLDHMEHD